LGVKKFLSFEFLKAVKMWVVFCWVVTHVALAGVNTERGGGGGNDVQGYMVSQTKKMSISKEASLCLSYSFIST
jgi:hypothetical protein